MAQSARSGYAEGMALAQTELPVWHPIRLGLALNFAVFHFEVLSNLEDAIRMAQDAFEAAIPELEKAPEEKYRDSVMIMQLLRDNLSLWCSEVGETGSGGEPLEVQDLQQGNP